MGLISITNNFDSHSKFKIIESKMKVNILRQAKEHIDSEWTYYSLTYNKFNGFVCVLILFSSFYFLD